MIIEKTFGETIRNLREERKLTLKVVAEALEIDTSMLGKIEKNNRKPSRSFIEKISSFFNINSKYLVIAFLSDEIAYHVIYKEDYASEIFKVAEEKVEYLKSKKKPANETDI